MLIERQGGVAVVRLRGGKANAMSEEVYLAMVSRGYEGRIPLTLAGSAATAGQWAAAASMPVVAAAIATVALLG